MINWPTVVIALPIVTPLMVVLAKFLWEMIPKRDNIERKDDKIIEDLKKEVHEFMTGMINNFKDLNKRIDEVYKLIAELNRS